MNKSGHQVLTIKAIHYPTVPRDRVCKILLGVKDREGKEEEEKKDGQWFPQNTPMMYPSAAAHEGCQ